MIIKFRSNLVLEQPTSLSWESLGHNKLENEVLQTSQKKLSVFARNRGFYKPFPQRYVDFMELVRDIRYLICGVTFTNAIKFLRCVCEKLKLDEIEKKRYFKIFHYYSARDNFVENSLNLVPIDSGGQNNL